MRNLDRRESTGEEDKQAQWTRIMMIQNEIKDRQTFNWKRKRVKNHSKVQGGSTKALANTSTG